MIDQRLDESIGAPGVLGIWGEWQFISKELRSTGNYFRGAREQACNFGDYGALPKSKKDKEKPPFCSIFYKFLLLQTPLVNSKCIYFRTTMLIYIDQREKYGNKVFF